MIWQPVSLQLLSLNSESTPTLNHSESRRAASSLRMPNPVSRAILTRLSPVGDVESRDMIGAESLNVSTAPSRNDRC